MSKQHFNVVVGWGENDLYMILTTLIVTVHHILQAEYSPPYFSGLEVQRCINRKYSNEVQIPQMCT